MTKSAIIIGSGFGGLGSAALLAKAGYQVTVLEKNEQLGGRASLLEVDQDQNGKWAEITKLTNEQNQATTGSEPILSDEMQGATEQHSKTYSKVRRTSSTGGNAADRAQNGFKFDMGPSWYLMPDIFEDFFRLLGENVHDHLTLTKLEPGYRVFFKDTDKTVDIYDDLTRDLKTVEELEPGAADKLQEYLKQAEYQYNVAINRFLYKNYDSILDFLNKETAIEGSKLHVFSNMDRYVKRYFKTEEMQKLMMYPLVFLGSSPYNTPALYNIMSHVDFNMGVFYPQGGIYEIVKAIVGIGKKLGATYRTNAEVVRIIVENGQAVGVELADGSELRADIVISDADVHHTETKLLEPKQRVTSDKYWTKRTLAPSALLIYMGVKGELPSLQHHTLIFSKDWRKNFGEIFDHPAWPDDPSLYICNPSKTDPSVAPEGYENLFVLVPIAAGLEYDQAFLDDYADKILASVEKVADLPGLRERTVYQKIFCVDDFTSRYNSYKGTALGLAHTITQTAIFRPSNINKKVKNLYYVGANTNPGIGMPITLISAELMYKRLNGDKSAGPLTDLS